MAAGGEGTQSAAAMGRGPGVVGRRRARPRPPRALVIIAPPVVETILGAFLPASPHRRRGGRRRPRGEKARGRRRRSEDGRPGGIAHGRPRQDKDGQPLGGYWRRSHANGRGMRAAAAKQGRPAATVRDRRQNKGPAATGGSHTAGHGGRRYAAGHGGVRTADRGGSCRPRQGDCRGGVRTAGRGGDRTWSAAAEQRMPASGGILAEIEAVLGAFFPASPRCMGRGRGRSGDAADALVRRGCPSLPPRQSYRLPWRFFLPATSCRRRGGRRRPRGEKVRGRPRRSKNGRPRRESHMAGGGETRTAGRRGDPGGDCARPTAE